MNVWLILLLISKAITVVEQLHHLPSQSHG